MNRVFIANPQGPSHASLPIASFHGSDGGVGCTLLQCFSRGGYIRRPPGFSTEQLSASARHFMAARLPGFVLTTRMLASYDTGYSFSRSLRRVRVHLPNGTRIGLAGVGEGDDILTLPSHYLVAEALQSPHWIRFAETSYGTSALWVPLGKDRTPKSIVYKDGTIAYEYETIGRQGDLGHCTCSTTEANTYYV